MDNGQKLAEILARYGMLHTARASNSPTSPPAAMPQQSVNVPATPPSLPQFNLYNDPLPPMNDYMAQHAPPSAPSAPAPQQAAPPPQAPMLPPDMPAMPPPQQVGPQGPTPEALALAQALQQRKLLPEQWRGSFSPGYGEPG